MRLIVICKFVLDAKTDEVIFLSNATLLSEDKEIIAKNIWYMIKEALYESSKLAPFERYKDILEQQKELTPDCQYYVINELINQK